MTNIYSIVVLALPFVNVRSLTVLPYKVHWLEISSNVGISLMHKNTIYCHRGSSKSIEKLWWTLEIHVKIKNGTFHLYTGNTAEEVFNDYKHSWFKQDSKSEIINANPFVTTCVFVESTDNCHVQIILKEVDRWRITVMNTGIILIFASKFLSRNPLFFYISASIFGIIALMLVLVYIISQRSIKQSIATAMLVTGWSSVAYFFRQFWAVQMNDTFMLKFIIVTGFVSLLVVYRIGPPTNPRSKYVMMWAIQAIGVVMIVWSSWYEEACGAIVIISLALTYIFQCVVRSIHRRSRDQILNLC